MKIIILFIGLTLLVACSGLKEKEAPVEKFACELNTNIFADKLAGIVGYSGFEVISADTADNSYLLIAQKLISVKGSGKEKFESYDQLRFRYSEMEKTVWVSHGVLTVSDGKKSFKAPPASDVQRHNELVLRTIDRIFTQCNPGQFPNRP